MVCIIPIIALIPIRLSVSGITEFWSVEDYLVQPPYFSDEKTETHRVKCPAQVIRWWQNSIMNPHFPAPSSAFLQLTWSHPSSTASEHQGNGASQ